jgi:hypothetical protein
VLRSKARVYRLLGGAGLRFAMGHRYVATTFAVFAAIRFSM